MGHDAVGEIAAVIEHGQAGLHGRSIHHNVANVEQGPNGVGYVFLWQSGTLSQDPNKFAQARQGDSDLRSLAEQLAG
jgi:hypothetical protein